MPSGGTAQKPRILRLRSTDTNVLPIDLLNSAGFCVREPGWFPGVAVLKGGGVRVESQSLDSSNLVAGGYENVVEEIPVSLGVDSMAERLEEMQEMLWNAEQYWLTGWQRGAVYIELQWDEESDVRYARVITGAYRFGNESFGDYRVGLPDNAIALEREPFWHDNSPGELTGPFANWCPNPSFEFWPEWGIENAVFTRDAPIGWYAQLALGAPPASFLMRREENQVAGPRYALDISFTTNGDAAFDWRLRGVMNWLGSPATYTLRYWLFLTLPAGTHTFEVRIINATTGAAVATDTYVANFTGWVYTTVNAPMLDDQLYAVELRWGGAFIVGAVPVRSVIDRITFTPGTWTADTWPAEDFYYSCTNIYGWEDDEMYYNDKVAFGEPRHCINYFDVRGIPGDVDAIMRMSVDRLGSKYGPDLDYPVLQYWMFQRRIEATNRVLDEEHISLNVDPMGYTGDDVTHATYNTSSESVVNVSLNAEDSWRRIYTFRTDGIEETEKYIGRFRVLGRFLWDPDEGYLDQDAQIRLVYWIGSQVNTTTLDTVNVADTDYFRLVNLTPRSLMDWLPLKEQPAALIFAIEVQMEGTEGTGELWLDDLLLGPTDSGMVSAEFDETTAWWIGQGLILDGDERSPMPVAVGAPDADDWIREVDMFRGIGVASVRYDTQTFLGSLYIVGTAGPGVFELTRFDHRGWASVASPLANEPSILEAWNGFLWVYEINADDLYTYHPSDAGTGFTNTDTFDDAVYDMLGFGGWLWACGTAGLIYQIDDTGTIAIDVDTGDHNWIVLEAYKRRLYVASAAGDVRVWTHLAGWTNLGTPAGANTIPAMKTWRGLLYLAVEGNGVWTYDGDIFTQVLAHVVAWGSESCLQVYDDVLYLGTGNAGGNAHIVYTEDGVNWTDIIIPADTVVGAMQPFDGRLLVAFGVPRDLDNWLPAQSSEWILWHTRSPAKLYTADYSGGAMGLAPEIPQRFYQKLEALNWNATPDAPDSYLERAAIGESEVFGPQTHISFSFDPRWRSLRGTD